MSAFVINRKVRLRIGFLFGIAYLVVRHADARVALVRPAVAFVGLLIRAWAAGHIVKNEQLTTTGPYAHTRNPLYFGSFLIAAGFALAAHWSLLLVVIALFAFIYGPTIETGAGGNQQAVSGGVRALRGQCAAVHTPPDAVARAIRRRIV